MIMIDNFESMCTNPIFTSLHYANIAFVSDEEKGRNGRDDSLLIEKLVLAFHLFFNVRVAHFSFYNFKLQSMHTKHRNTRTFLTKSKAGLKSTQGVERNADLITKLFIGANSGFSC